MFSQDPNSSHFAGIYLELFHIARHPRKTQMQKSQVWLEKNVEKSFKSEKAQRGWGMQSRNEKGLFRIVTCPLYPCYRVLAPREHKRCLSNSQLRQVPSISQDFVSSEMPRQTQFPSPSRGTCLSQEHRCFAKYFALWSTVPVESNQHMNSQLELPLNSLKPLALTCQIFSEAGIASYIFTYVCCNTNSVYTGENKKSWEKSLLLAALAML